MNDRQRAEELLAQAWQGPQAYALERLELLLSALVHAVLASDRASRRSLRAEREAERRERTSLSGLSRVKGR